MENNRISFEKHSKLYLFQNVNKTTTNCYYFRKDELENEFVIEEFSKTVIDGKLYQTKYYNLENII